MLTPGERAGLRALLAAGTELPWQVGDSQLGEAWVWAEVRGYMRGIGAPPARELVHAPPAHLFDAGQGEQAVADAWLIAAAVNALPELLDDLDEAERRLSAAACFVVGTAPASLHVDRRGPGRYALVTHQGDPLVLCRDGEWRDSPNSAAAHFSLGEAFDRAAALLAAQPATTPQTSDRPGGHE